MEKRPQGSEGGQRQEKDDNGKKTQPQHWHIYSRQGKGQGGDWLVAGTEEVRVWTGSKARTRSVKYCSVSPNTELETASSPPLTRAHPRTVAAARTAPAAAAAAASLPRPPPSLSLSQAGRGAAWRVPPLPARQARVHLGVHPQGYLRISQDI